MDPTQNPTTNPNPNPTPGPMPGTDPVVPGASAAPAPSPVGAAPGVAASGPAPVTPVTPVTPADTNPMGAPTAAAAAAGANPVIQPGGGAVNPVQTDGLLATDPIMKPEPAPAPDPVQQELEAPMKAAAPVPGSIGSSISGDGKQAAAPANKMPVFNNPFKKKETPSVAFNDPATQQDNPGEQTAAPAGNMPIKKNNKTTLIILIAAAAIVIVVLVVILIITLTSGGNNSNRLSNEETNTEIEEPEDEIPEYTTIACSRAMTPEEAAAYGVASGTISIMGSFDDYDELAVINLAKYSGDATQATQVTETTETTETTATTDAGTTTTTTESTETTTTPGATIETSANLLESSQVLIEDLTPDMAGTYYLTVDEDGNLVTLASGVQGYWESLAFTCGE